MLTFKQFLIEENDDDYLYHATYKPYMKSIMKHGLHGKGKKNYEDSENKVYLAKTPEVAKSYAETSDTVPEHYLDQIKVLKIHRKHLDPQKLHKDLNVRSDEPNDTVEYHGTIDPKHIKVHE